jgi:hypothetical protein
MGVVLVSSPILAVLVETPSEESEQELYAKFDFILFLSASKVEICNIVRRPEHIRKRGCLRSWRMGCRIGTKDGDIERRWIITRVICCSREKASNPPRTQHQNDRRW